MRAAWVHIKGTAIQERELKGVDENGNTRKSYQARINRKGFARIIGSCATREEAEDFILKVLKDQKEEEAARQDPRATLPSSGDWRDQRISQVLLAFSESNDCLNRHRGHIESTKRLACDATIRQLNPSWITRYIERARKPNAREGRKPTARKSGKPTARKSREPTASKSAPYAWNTIRIQLSIISVAMKWRAKALDETPPAFVVDKKFFEAAGRGEDLDLTHGKWRNRRTRRLEEGEEQALMAELSKARGPGSEHLRLLVPFALATCARLKEIALASWTEISPLVKTWLIARHKTEERAWTINPDTRILVERLHAIRGPKNDLIFHGLNYKGLSQRLNRIIKKAGLVDFRFHDLRHEAITRFVASSEADMELVMQSVGHSTMEMTRTYTHLREHERERLMVKQSGGGLGSLNLPAMRALAGQTSEGGPSDGRGAGGGGAGAEAGAQPAPPRALEAPLRELAIAA